MSEERKILGAVYIAATAVLIDLTAVDIALPTISHHFGISSATASLLLLASMLTSSACALIAGKITEIKNIKSLLLIGFVSLGALNFLCFLTPDFSILIIIRFFNGFALSLIYVIGPAVIRKYLPQSEQQSSYGIWMMCTGIGIAAGPLLGSLLIEGFDWNYVFLINVFLSLASLIFTPVLFRRRQGIRNRDVGFADDDIPCCYADHFALCIKACKEIFGQIYLYHCKLFAHIINADVCILGNKHPYIFSGSFNAGARRGHGLILSYQLVCRHD